MSTTAVGNAPSRRVMVKLGMTYDPRDDFDHPNVPVGSPLRRHVVYRLGRAAVAAPAAAPAATADRS